jgi:hypothetical protein
MNQSFSCYCVQGPTGLVSFWLLGFRSIVFSSLNRILMVPCHFLAQKWHKFVRVNNVKFQFIYYFSLNL